MKKIGSIAELNALIGRYLIKGTITNNYLLLDTYTYSIDHGKLYYILTKQNVCILQEKDQFYQVYYYLNDLEEQIDINTLKPVTMEILYRGESQYPTNILGYWQRNGLKLHLIRESMMSTYDQLILPQEINPDIEIKYAVSELEANFTKDIIDTTFDKYTGDVLTIEEIKMFISNKNILAAYWKDNLTGILQFEIRNNVVWIGHIAISPNFRGKGIAKALVEAYVINNVVNQKTRYQLWVLQDNLNAKALYSKFGFKYANKSSISMLKN